ncbi:MAG: hypothetical protein ACRCY9_05225 [Phycicoccus sp.]
MPTPGPASAEVARPATVRTGSDGVPDGVGVPPVVRGCAGDVVGDGVAEGVVVPCGGLDAEAVAEAEGAGVSGRLVDPLPGLGPVVDEVTPGGRVLVADGRVVVGFGVDVVAAAGGAVRGC